MSELGLLFLVLGVAIGPFLVFGLIYLIVRFIIFIHILKEYEKRL